MICPACHYNGTRVVDSRPAEENRSFEDVVNVKNAHFGSQLLRKWKKCHLSS